MELRGAPRRYEADMILEVAPIAAAEFAPFGELLEQPHPAPRQDFAISLHNSRADATVNVALVQASPLATSTVNLLERHRYSNQLFVPIDVDAYVIVVGSGVTAPERETLRAFRVGGKQAINYRPNTWHMNIATLVRPGTFIMLVHENGAIEDCEFCSVAPIRLRGI